MFLKIPEDVSWTGDFTGMRGMCTETLQQELGEAYKALFPIGNNASMCLMGKGREVSLKAFIAGQLGFCSGISCSVGAQF